MTYVAVLDVRIVGDAAASLPPRATFHIGSAAVRARVRPLGPDTARLTLDAPLPLRIGDRGLLRDPGRHHVAGGVTVLDVAPPALRRRGAAATRGKELEAMTGTPDEAAELRRRRLVRRADLERMGVEVRTSPVAGDWLADPAAWDDLRTRLPEVVTGWQREHALEPGAPIEVLRQELHLPDRSLVRALVRAPLVEHEGRVRRQEPGGPSLPEPVARAVAALAAELERQPFAAPDAGRLDALGLGPRELAAAVRSGALLKVADRVVLLPDAPQRAVRLLSALPQPFTVSEARAALATSRRVAVPFLELLDRQGSTQRLPDDRRQVTGASG
jgi:selenocysteine-specific elongation factor